MGNLLTSVIGKIGSYLPKFLTQGLKLIGQLAIGIIKAIPGIVAKIPQVIRAMISAFSGVKKQFFNIGSDLIKGLWNGINSVKDWIMGKISGFVGGITSGIKDFFGIKSPSTVMADEVGKWIPAGLAEGIEESEDTVFKSLRSMYDGMISLGTPELALGTGRMAFGGSGGASSGVFNEGDTKVTNHIEVIYQSTGDTENDVRRLADKIDAEFAKRKGFNNYFGGEKR